jgi:hypothetical protein
MEMNKCLNQMHFRNKDSAWNTARQRWGMDGIGFAVKSAGAKKPSATGE